MDLRRTKWFAALFLCLYALALMHQLAPHHEDTHDAARCGLCLLVFGTVLIAAFVSLHVHFNVQLRHAILPQLKPVCDTISPSHSRAPPSTWIRNDIH